MAASLRPVDAQHTADGRSTRPRAGVGLRRTTLPVSQVVLHHVGRHLVQESEKRPPADRRAGRNVRRRCPRRPETPSRRWAKAPARAVLADRQSKHQVCGPRAVEQGSKARSRSEHLRARPVRPLAASTLTALEQAHLNCLRPCAEWQMVDKRNFSDSPDAWPSSVGVVTEGAAVPVGARPQPDVADVRHVFFIADTLVAASASR